MIVDLHTHNSVGSGDSRVSPRELVVKAKQRGISAICVTDHDSHRAVQEIRKIGCDEGILVFKGIELSTRYGHLLILGVDVYELIGGSLKREVLDELISRIRADGTGIQRLSEIFKVFYYRLFSEINCLIRMVHESKGAVVLAHPFGGYDPTTTNMRYYLDRYLMSSNSDSCVKTTDLLTFVKKQDPTLFNMLHQVDGIEVLNPLCWGVENRAAFVLANYLHKNWIGGSDCHTPSMVGICATEFSKEMGSEEEFLSELKKYGTTNPKINIKKDEVWPWWGNERHDTFRLFNSLGS